MNYLRRVILNRVHNRTLGHWLALTSLVKRLAKLDCSVKTNARKRVKRCAVNHVTKLAMLALMAASTILLAGEVSAQTAIINGHAVNRGQDARGNASQPGADVTPPANVDVGGLIATTHELAKKDFLEGNYDINRNGSSGSFINGEFINDDELKARLDDHIALMAPEVLNQGVIVAQHGKVALTDGEHIQLDFGTGNKLQGITVKKQDLDTHIENKHAIITEDSLVILSATAIANLRANIIKDSAQTVASIGANTVNVEGGRISLDDGATGDLQILGQMVATVKAPAIQAIQATPTPQNTARPSKAKETTDPLDANRRIAARTTAVTNTAKLDVNGAGAADLNLQGSGSAVSIDVTGKNNTDTSVGGSGSDSITGGIGSDTVAMNGDLFLATSNPEYETRTYIAVDLHNYMRYGAGENAMTDREPVKPSGWVLPSGVISLKAANGASVFNTRPDINWDMPHDQSATAKTRGGDTGTDNTGTDAVRATAAEFTLNSGGYNHHMTSAHAAETTDGTNRIALGAVTKVATSDLSVPEDSRNDVLTRSDRADPMNGGSMKPTYLGSVVAPPAETHKRHSVDLDTVLTILDGVIEQNGPMDSNLIRLPGGAAIRAGLTQAGGVAGNAPLRYVIFGDTGQYVVSRSWNFTGGLLHSLYPTILLQ